MLRRVLGGWLAVLAVCVAASPAAAEVSTMEVTLNSGDEGCKAFVARPEGNGPFPGIVVIQEWWGLTDWIKDNAKRLAGQGYVAIAPDLYHGKATDQPQVARQLSSGLPRDRALRDLKAAVAWLQSQSFVNKDKIGSIGWCMGGGFSLQLALHDPAVKACAMCYGQVVTDASKLEPLQAKVLGSFGGKDRGIKPAQVRKFEAAAKEAGKHVDVKIYEDADHGFMRPVNNRAYNEEAANDSWRRIEAFFAKNLKH